MEQKPVGVIGAMGIEVDAVLAAILVNAACWIVGGRH